MSWKKLQELVGDSTEGLAIIKGLQEASDGNVKTINDLERKITDVTETRDKFKMGNSTVKSILGLDEINEETLKEFLASNSKKGGDEKLLSEVENLKKIIETVNGEKATLTGDYEGKLSKMAMTNALRDLGIGAVAASPTTEKDILRHLEAGASLVDGKTIYKNEDGTTVYNGSEIMTPQMKFEQMRSSAEFSPYFKPAVNNDGSGFKPNQGGGNQAGKVTMPRSEFQTQSAEAKSKFFADGGQITD